MRDTSKLSTKCMFWFCCFVTENSSCHDCVARSKAQRLETYNNTSERCNDIMDARDFRCKLFTIISSTNRTVDFGDREFCSNLGRMLEYHVHTGNTYAHVNFYVVIVNHNNDCFIFNGEKLWRDYSVHYGSPPWDFSDYRLPPISYCNIPSQTPSFTRAPWYYTLGTPPRIYIHTSRKFPHSTTTKRTYIWPDSLFFFIFLS